MKNLKPGNSSKNKIILINRLFRSKLPSGGVLGSIRNLLKISIIFKNIRI